MPLLSTVTSIKLGSTNVTAVYHGINKVWPITSNISGIMVSGAGLSAANGLYLEAGIYEGAPYYVNTLNNYQIYLPSSVDASWVIALDGPSGSGAAYETNEINLTSPVDGTWIAPYGNTPAPTVTFS